MATSGRPKQKDDQSGEKRRVYFAGLPPTVRKDLAQLRGAIRSAAPGAVESFSYGMPAFTMQGRPLVWYAAWKQHFGLYPMSAAIFDAHAPSTSSYDGTKGTIRFPLTAPPSPALVRRLIRARIAEMKAGPQ